MLKKKQKELGTINNFKQCLLSLSRCLKMENLQSSIFKKVKFGESVEDFKKNKKPVTPTEIVDKNGRMIPSRSGIEIFKSSIILA
jgi:hypothetical protein